MPRGKKNGGEPTPARQGNGTPEQMKSLVQRIEKLEADKATRMSEALSDCRSIQQDIKQVYKDAKDEIGLTKKALASVIKARKLERKAKAARDELDQEHQDQHDVIRHALGDLADTPLGRAALGEDEADVRPPFLQQKTAEAEGKAAG